ncbi:MAG: hypothetical protein Q9191_000078 [Dirinaria sp. TL-2023a]
MDEPESNRTEASVTRLHRSRSQPSPLHGSDRQPRLSRVFSAQHLDDHSHYHGDIEPRNRASLETTPIEESDFSEKGPETEDREAGSLSGEANEVREGIANEGDVEAPLEKVKSSRSNKPADLVTWDGPNDPENPKNWSKKVRWGATLVVSSFTFISPVSSSMVAPAIVSIATEFKITNEVEQQMVLSVFILAYAVGPLFLGPLSEIYGRVPVLQLANLFFLVFNSAAGGSKNKGEMIAFRFLSGLGGSAPLAVGGGVLSDCWKPEERGRAISIYSLAPLLGPAIGPIAGGFITQNTTWRWAFYSVSIADALIQLLGLFLLRESYAPKLLHAKANKLRKETGNRNLHTEYEHSDRNFANTMKRSLIRPFRLLGTQHIIQVLALYMAYLYGLMYLVLSTFPVLWTERYHESIGIGGLNYISLALGFFLGTQICAPLNDKIYRRLKHRNDGIGKPEFRIPLMVPGSILVPSGLFLYGSTPRS